MNTLGQACLLIAFVASGFAAFGCLVGSRPKYTGRQRTKTNARVRSG